MSNDHQHVQSGGIVDAWTDLEISRAIRAAASGEMPQHSLALYARWWQLETWLRALAYVELRAKYGVSWIEVVKAAVGRQTQDAAYTHMSGADNENPLAYLDYKQMLEVMDTHWDQFGYALLEKRSWDGRQEELLRIRHRIGHLRKPHPDDLGRLEQTLRDLELGTFRALASYNARATPDPQKDLDPITEAWIRGHHPTAQRLVKHAGQQYGTTLHMHMSRRPWAERPVDLANAPGILWHAEFVMRDRTVDARNLWHNQGVSAAHALLVHMVAENPGHIEFTFSGADDPHAVADAIGHIFDAVLLVGRYGPADDDVTWIDWEHRARHLDYRVLNGTGWNIVDETTIPISNFGAGGGVEALPPIWST